jgi:hypothetical protein
MDQSVMWLVIGLAGLVGMAYVFLVYEAIVQVIRREGITSAARALWVFGIVLFPPFASMAWYLFGHCTAEVERSLGFAVSRPR